MGNLDSFFEIIKGVKDVLDGFQTPIGLSYWDCIIYFGFASIVIVALVNKLPLGLVDGAFSTNAKDVKQSNKPSNARQHFQSQSDRASRSTSSGYNPKSKMYPKGGTGHGANYSVPRSTGRPGTGR